MLIGMITRFGGRDRRRNVRLPRRAAICDARAPACGVFAAALRVELGERRARAVGADRPFVVVAVVDAVHDPADVVDQLDPLAAVVERAEQPAERAARRRCGLAAPPGRPAITMYPPPGTTVPAANVTSTPSESFQFDRSTFTPIWLCSSIHSGVPSPAGLYMISLNTTVLSSTVRGSSDSICSDRRLNAPLMRRLLMLHTLKGEM